MSRTNVLGKGTLSLIIGGLAVAITLSGCDSPVGSATETTAPRDGVMRVLPDRFTLDTPASLRQQDTVTSRAITTSVTPNTVNWSALNMELMIIEHSRRVLDTAFWLVLADEALSNDNVPVGISNKENTYRLTFDQSFVDRAIEYLNLNPIYADFIERIKGDSDQEDNLCSAWCEPYRKELLDEDFAVNYTYNFRANEEVYRHFFNMEISFWDEDEVIVDITIAWSDDLQNVAIVDVILDDDEIEVSSSDDESDDGPDGNSGRVIKFFAYDGDLERSFYMSMDFGTDDGDHDAQYREVILRRKNPNADDDSLTFYMGRLKNVAGRTQVNSSVNSFVADLPFTRGLVDDLGGALQSGGTTTHFDANGRITESNERYSFSTADFPADLWAVNTLQASNMELPDVFNAFFF